MGRTLAAALRAKYEYREEAGRAPELVGGEKTGRQQALATLTRVYLAEHAIDDPGPAGEIAALCGAIEELDLEANELTHWEGLVSIVSQLPKLHYLGLSRMPLSPFTDIPVGLASAVGNLRIVCLSSTGMPWDQLLLLASVMPELAELQFNSNGVMSTAPSDGLPLPLTNLKTLWLEGNQLSTWDAIEPLSVLPKLEVLNLNYNGLATIPAPHAGFSTLRHLMIRGNNLSHWASIDALDHFPALSEARIAELPVTATVSGAVARRIIIARVGKLTVL